MQKTSLAGDAGSAGNREHEGDLHSSPSKDFLIAKHLAPLLAEHVPSSPPSDLLPRLFRLLHIFCLFPMQDKTKRHFVPG